MIASIRPLSYPGSVVPAVGYNCTPEQLRFKAEIVMADTRDLTGWPLSFRRRVANALTTKAWVAEVEGNHG